MTKQSDGAAIPTDAAAPSQDDAARKWRDLATWAGHLLESYTDTACEEVQADIDRCLAAIEAAYTTAPAPPSPVPPTDIRRQTIEECARVCENYGATVSSHAKFCAAAIRALAAPVGDAK